MPQQHVFKTLENDPLFGRRPGEDLTIEKMRELTFLRYKHNKKCIFYCPLVMSSVHIKNKASDKNPQGEAALPLRLHDKRRGDC